MSAPGRAAPACSGHFPRELAGCLASWTVRWRRRSLACCRPSRRKARCNACTTDMPPSGTRGMHRISCACIPPARSTHSGCCGAGTPIGASSWPAPKKVPRSSFISNASCRPPMRRESRSGCATTIPVCCRPCWAACMRVTRPRGSARGPLGACCAPTAKGLWRGAPARGDRLLHALGAIRLDEKNFVL